MTDEEIERWKNIRIDVIRKNLDTLSYERLRTYFKEVVSAVVQECVNVEDTDWPEMLHLSDVIEKHIGRGYRATVDVFEREKRQSGGCCGDSVPTPRNDEGTGGTMTITWDPQAILPNVICFVEPCSEQVLSVFHPVVAEHGSCC